MQGFLRAQDSRCFVPINNRNKIANTDRRQVSQSSLPPIIVLN